MSQSWTIRCPLHDDKRPSLYIKVSDDGIFWRCYAGCRSPELKDYVYDFLRDKGFDIANTSEKAQEQLRIMESFETLHINDFDTRGLSVKDAVRYGLKPARYGRYSGLAIPLYNHRGTLAGYQFCNLTPPRNPKYISLVKSLQPSYVGEPIPEVLVVAEGHYKAICIHKHLSRVAMVRNLLVVGITSKTSYKEAESIIIDKRRLSQCIIALDRDVSDAERQRMVESIRRVVGDTPISFPAYEIFDGSCKGFDDCLANLHESVGLDRLVTSEYSQFVVRANRVDISPVQWLIDDYVPYQCITVIEGKPGVGKSYLTLAIASAATLGRARINSNLGYVPVNGIRGRSCLIVNCEDPQPIIASRLQQIGAPLENCLIVTKHIRLPSDAGTLESIIRGENVGVMVLDTLSNHLDSGYSSNDESAIRTILSVVSVLCQKHNLIALVVRHLRKSSSDDDGLEAGIGSIGIAGIARSVIRVSAFDCGSRATLIKSNYSRCNIAFEYDVSSLKVEPLADGIQVHSVIEQHRGHDVVGSDTIFDASSSSQELEI